MTHEELVQQQIDNLTRQRDALEEQRRTIDIQLIAIEAGIQALTIEKAQPF
jgi:hypothetical protein